VKSKVRALAGMVGDSRCSSVYHAGDIRLGYGSDDAAEIVTINQIGIAILAQSKH
jgi:hypothetical protein